MIKCDGHRWQTIVSKHLTGAFYDQYSWQWTSYSVHDNNNRNIFIYVKRMSHLCIAEQTVGQVEQTKGDARLLLRVTRGSVSMARCHGFPRVTRLFLMWRGGGQWELRSGGHRWRTGMDGLSLTHTHTPACTHNSNASHQGELEAPSACRRRHRCRRLGPKGIDRNDWFKRKTFVKSSCSWNNMEGMGARHLVWTKSLFKRKVLLCVKAQRCSSYALLICASMLWGDKGERFSLALPYSGVLIWSLDSYDNVYVQYSTSVDGGWTEGDPQFHGEPDWLLLMNDRQYWTCF